MPTLSQLHGSNYQENHLADVQKSFPTGGFMRTGVLLTPSAPFSELSEIQQPMKNRRIQLPPKNAEPDW
jgi:hypothetical protein